LVDVLYANGRGVVALPERPPMSETIRMLEVQVGALTEQLRRLRSEFHRDGGDAPARSALSVEMLGGLRVQTDGRPVTRWGGRRNRMTFLFILNHHPRAVHREELIEALWPGSDPTTGRNNLNQAIHGARTAFRRAGVAVPIDYSADCYRITPGVDVLTDVSEFERLAAAGLAATEGRLDLLMAAARTYTGDYLVDEPYQTWVDDVRIHLSRVHRDVLDAASRLLLDEGRYAESIAICRQILNAEPTYESAHQRLMIALARDGRRCEALQAFERCRDLLERELGVAPALTTRRVAMLLRAGAAV
jgi:DNA-binding SARP family transcriptional activator